MGKIHSFETLGTVDGPGLRFIVFMQGCPLRCLYCHNRDTRNIEQGQNYTVDEVVAKAEKYRPYITPNGGITITGGEPLMQVEFVTEVFKKLKEDGISTALDTSGFISTERIGELLKYTDLVLLDIKTVNNEIHKYAFDVNSWL